MDSFFPLSDAVTVCGPMLGSGDRYKNGALDLGYRETKMLIQTYNQAAPPVSAIEHGGLQESQHREHRSGVWSLLGSQGREESGPEGRNSRYNPRGQRAEDAQDGSERFLARQYQRSCSMFEFHLTSIAKQEESCLPLRALVMNK